ncbi:MAG: hypothetical protein ABSF71_24795 [Terriglobia bacterium]
MMNRKFWPLGAVLAILLVCTLGGSFQLLAQQAEQAPSPARPQTQTAAPQTQSATPQTQPATSQTQTKPANDTGQKQPAKAPKTLENDRIFFALPNYLTVEKASKLPPLTTKQKFKAVAEGCFDPVEVVFIGIQSGIGQADNTNPTYGQGFVGYSKRFGTAYTDAIIGNFGTGAIFPTLLRQDPRYFQRGKGNFFFRFGYAAMRVLITRSDTSGKTQFNFSEFLGNGMAAGIANAYHPEPHTLASNVNVMTTQVGMDALGYELKEFWPDIHRLLNHAKHKT